MPEKKAQIIIATEKAVVASLLHCDQYNIIIRQCYIILILSIIIQMFKYITSKTNFYVKRN